MNGAAELGKYGSVGFPPACVGGMDPELMMNCEGKNLLFSTCTKRIISE